MATVAVAALVAVCVGPGVPPATTGALRAEPGRDDAGRAETLAGPIRDPLLIVPLTWQGRPMTPPVDAFLDAARAASTALEASGLRGFEVTSGAPFARGYAVASPCDPGGWAASLRSQRGIAADVVIAFVAPHAACTRERGWLGLADGPRRALAFSEDGGAGEQRRVWLHELGHLLGLGHAGRTNCPTRNGVAVAWSACAPLPGAGAKGDVGTVMGQCDCGFAPHELLALGSAQVGEPVILEAADVARAAATVSIASPYDPAAPPDMPRLVVIRDPGVGGELLVSYDAPGLALSPPGLDGAGVLRIRRLPTDGSLTTDADLIADVRTGAAWSDASTGISIHVAAGALPSVVDVTFAPAGSQP